jgi:GWxTD domain-containing protein
VRVLLTDDERRAFGALGTDEERAAFVERFWQRLDPDPATSVNEFRDTFEARCALASERFESIGGPAWSSDRGRVLILLGEPRSVRRETAGLLAVEKEVWVYATRDDASGTEIPFFRCGNGAYRLDPTCPGVDPLSVSSWSVSHRTLWGTFGAPGSPGVSKSQLDEVVASVRGGTTEISQPRRSAPVEEERTTTSSRGGSTEAFSDAAYFFRAQDGTVLTMLAIELPEKAPDAPEGRVLAAVTLEEQSGAATRTLLLDPSGPPEGNRVFIGRSYLPPRSTHAARFAIKDESQGQILVRNRRLDVPDLSGFSASSVVPAERFGPAGTDARLVVGSEEVLPRPGGVFRTGELLRLYLQVYGAAVDPRTSMPRVDVSFRFSSDAKDRPRSMRQPFKVTGAAGASMGLALPVGDWPAGTYRVDVDLHDRVSGARASVAGAFRIVAR